MLLLLLYFWSNQCNLEDHKCLSKTTQTAELWCILQSVFCWEASSIRASPLRSPVFLWFVFQMKSGTTRVRFLQILMVCWMQINTTVQASSGDLRFSNIHSASGENACKYSICGEGDRHICKQYGRYEHLAISLICSASNIRVHILDDFIFACKHLSL